jgi:broad specificity phosphatase PhoE
MELEQKWPDNLIIVRHGQSKRNVANELAKKNGQHHDFSEGVRDQDTPLTPIGEMQSLSVGVELRRRFGPDDPTDIIFVSPYLRTRQTMEKIIEGLGYRPHIIVDERIREIEFGILDGLSGDGIEAKYPDEVKRRAKEGKYFYRPPGGESRPDVKIRIRSFLDTIVRDCRGLNVVVVCHSVVVLSFRALLERWGEEEYLQVDKENDVKNASVTHYQFDRKLRLTEYNSVFYSDSDIHSVEVGD